MGRRLYASTTLTVMVEKIIIMHNSHVPLSDVQRVCHTHYNAYRLIYMYAVWHRFMCTVLVGMLASTCLSMCSSVGQCVRLLARWVSVPHRHLPHTTPLALDGIH